jgi:hypothetical protein
MVSNAHSRACKPLWDALSYVTEKLGYWGATEQKTRLRIQVTSRLSNRTGSGAAVTGEGDDSRQTGPDDRNSKIGVDPILIRDDLAALFAGRS